jgi:hypothetical protein
MGTIGVCIGGLVGRTAYRTVWGEHTPFDFVPSSIEFAMADRQPSGGAESTSPTQQNAERADFHRYSADAEKPTDPLLCHNLLIFRGLHRIFRNAPGRLWRLCGEV